jgi:hypothetical protein
MKHALALFFLVAAVPAAVAQAPDVAWPREVKAADGTVITVYQPQLERWANNALSARAAVSVAKPGEKAPRFGVIELTARSEVDKAADLVTLSAVRIAKGSFPGTSEQESGRYLAMLRAALPDRGWPASAQALQANLAITQARSAQKSLPVKNDPPQIVFRTAPSLLVMIDGEPALRPAKGEPSLMRVINSAALILQEPSSANFYLWALGRWWEAMSATAGDWKPAGAPPPSLDKAREAAGKDLDPLEGKDADGKPRFEAGVVPQIIVATKPTELLQAKGEPRFSPIPGTQLPHMANSSNDIFMESAHRRTTCPSSAAGSAAVARRALSCARQDPARDFA